MISIQFVHTENMEVQRKSRTFGPFESVYMHNSDLIGVKGRGPEATEETVAWIDYTYNQGVNGHFEWTLASGDNSKYNGWEIV